MPRTQICLVLGLDGRSQLRMARVQRLGRRMSGSTRTMGRLPRITSPGVTFIMDGITNLSVADTSYYLQLSTYNNTNCSSSPVDNVTVTFMNTSGPQISLTVNPTLSFSVAGISSSTSCDGGSTTAASTSTTIPFGSVTSAVNGFICQQSCPPQLTRPMATQSISVSPAI